MHRPTEKRKALQPIMRPNSFSLGTVKTMNRRISLQKNKLVSLNETETKIQTEEDLFEAAMRWDESNRENLIEKQKMDLVKIRDQLLSEKKRILMKETEVEAKQIQLNGLSKAYSALNAMYSGEIAVDPNMINDIMNEIEYPEDSFEARDDHVNSMLFEIAPTGPKPLPDCVLQMSNEDFETFKVAYDEEESRSQRFMVPSDDAITNGAFDADTVTMYKNWLNAVADEVDVLTGKEKNLDQALGELDSNIESTSSLISLNMKLLGFIPTETE